MRRGCVPIPNKRYISGRNLEYLVKRKLEKQGYYVCRSAGSHGVDLVAIKMGSSDFQFINEDGTFSKIHDLRFVSCKVGEYETPRAREELKQLAAKYGAQAMTTKKVDGKWELAKIE